MGKIRICLAGGIIMAVLAGCSETSGTKASPSTGDLMQGYAAESQARADLTVPAIDRAPAATGRLAPPSLRDDVPSPGINWGRTSAIPINTAD